eukprot:gnl/MRDRNA2_/MRDRNA2_3650_c0_seq1.p1 gnl/MRDRNA2_/MRDRNA2_3650_c0~~gnl/MRDRNA2_/MRDRNA2_3650_c0_seq1.p1  ORF type:complete len:100 (-),score=3.96 gnl/MRDRNA2_/MRDRNA2_3650_c0_seq1:32-331(-)
MPLRVLKIKHAATSPFCKLPCHMLCWQAIACKSHTYRLYAWYGALAAAAHLYGVFANNSLQPLLQHGQVRSNKRTCGNDSFGLLLRSASRVSHESCSPQ